ncbi:cytochrome P450 [Favolaschia claudopus]|uniref:Cytochrome P450 n=1 Tax=Favolaschia claudopus TaxID=2862362 RepID=A0AAW0C4D9_9AGAR
MSPVALSLSIALTLMLVSVLSLRRPRSLSLPPGPPKLPLLGNMYNVPKYCPWEAYAQYSKELGSDIIHVGLPGASIVVLCSLQAARDLLDKRAAIYSDRRFLASQLPSYVICLELTPCHLQRRTHRRLFHKSLGGPAANRFRSQSLAHAQDLVRRLTEKPEAYAEHFDYVISASMISIAYGLDVAPTGDEYISTADAILDIFLEALTPGKFLVDAIPLLKHVPAWVPGAGFQHKAVQWKREIREWLDTPFQAAKQMMDEGSARPSFTMDNLREMEHSEVSYISEDDIKYVAGTIYSAGKDTTRLALRVFVRGILENRAAQRNAQQQIDKVLGCKPGHRLPTFEDEPDLPWVTACVKETLRWWPVLPLGLARCTSAEDVYEGHRIPAGSFVLPNVWAILHDETVYPDPESFKPERFLLPDGRLNLDVPDPDIAIFGFGRRICAGQQMGWNTVWIMVASMLAAFDITKARDESTGEVIEPSVGHTSEIMDAPVPFKCSIQRRFVNRPVLDEL